MITEERSTCRNLLKEMRTLVRKFCGKRFLMDKKGRVFKATILKPGGIRSHDQSPWWQVVNTPIDQAAPGQGSVFFYFRLLFS
jgi:hypothetical protein